MAPVILYDIPSKGPKKECWSLNPWKPRMILNYKGIDYKSEWVEYPDLEPTFKSFGLPPNDKNDPGYFKDYTSPAVRFEDGTLAMDSWKIAQEIEKRYPTPPLHLDEPIVAQIRDQIGNIFAPLRANLLPKIPKALSEKSAEYFERTRADMFGMSLEKLEKEQGKEENWELVKGPAKETADLLRAHSGPFFLGKKVTYADFIFVSFLEFLRRIDPPSYEKFMSLDPAFKTLYDASKEWVKRAD